MKVRGHNSIHGENGDLKMSRPGLDSGAQVCTVLLVSLFPHMELRGEDL